jgi:hypothetical protein
MASKWQFVEGASVSDAGCVHDAVMAAVLMKYFYEVA